MLELQPIDFDELCSFIEQYHRHHVPPRGWKFGIAVNDGTRVVGVVSVGRPVARRLHDGWTLEATRVCTLEDVKNADSKLYGAAWRAAKALGYKRLVTYTLPTESGASLRGAGWKLIGETRGGSWDRADRPRVDKHPTQPKLIWHAS